MERCSCPLCGQDRPAFFLAGSDRLHGTPSRYQLVRCGNCALVYLSPRPTLDEIARIYPPEYGPHQVVKCRASALRRVDIAFGMGKRARFVDRYTAGPGRVLDVGCATGEFLLEMRGRGWQVAGVEISPSAAQIAIDAGLDVHVGTVESGAFELGRLDLVTLWDVIEHLHDPVKTVREINCLLKPGGVLVFSTPDLDALDARLFGDYWAGLDIPRHLCLFDGPTASRLLASTGFELVAQQYLTGSYHVFLMSLQARLRDARWPASIRGGALRVVGLPVLRLLAWPFFRVVEFLQVGPVMTIVARKASN